MTSLIWWTALLTSWVIRYDLIASVYGQGLYTLAAEEGLCEDVLSQLKVLNVSFTEEPAFQRLLMSANLTKDERCQILDDSFRGRVHPYVLNFLKLLTEKGYIRHFSDCCKVYQEQYNEDNGILPVCAVSAVALTADQSARLTEKLSKLTGKTISLTNRIDPACLGGVRLDYNGKRIDGTLQSRLDAVATLLKNTVL